MSDISKCEGEGCDKRHRCYRFIASEDPVYQSWIKPDPKDCKEFINTAYTDLSADSLYSTSTIKMLCKYCGNKKEHVCEHEYCQYCGCPHYCHTD